MKGIIIVGICGLFLMACDRGQTALDGALEKYGYILNEDVNEKNAEDAKLLAANLKIIIKEYSEKPSAQKAKLILSALQKKAIALKAKLERELDRKNGPVFSKAIALDKIAKPISARAKNFIYDFMNPKTVRQGQCLAYDDSSEFDDEQLAISSLKIQKVKKVGVSEVLLEDVFSGSVSDLQHPSEALKKENEISTDYKELAVNKLTIDCKVADQIVVEYKKLLELALNSEPLRKQLTVMASILSPDQM
jgi:hypothetical protein